MWVHKWFDEGCYTPSTDTLITVHLNTFSDLNIRLSTLLSLSSLERRRSKQLAPTRLNSLLKTTSSVHSHNVKNSKYNLFIPRPNTEAGKQSFQYRGSVLWINLPLSTKIQPTISSFKPCHVFKDGFIFPFLWYKRDYATPLANGHRTVLESIVVTG